MAGGLMPTKLHRSNRIRLPGNALILVQELRNLKAEQQRLAEENLERKQQRIKELETDNQRLRKDKNQTEVRR